MRAINWLCADRFVLIRSGLIHRSLGSDKSLDMHIPSNLVIDFLAGFN